MRIGIIDLGTNSVRFNVHSIGRNGKPRLLHQEKLMIRLGEGVFLKGKLDTKAVHRALDAFISFRHTATLLQAEQIIAFATSALREASDAETLTHLIREKTHIDIRVISGEEKAQLIAMGILANEKSLKGKFGLVDIGGGSTEISVCRGKKILYSSSFPLGTARLQQVFLKTSPPQSIKGTDVEPISALRRNIKATLLPKLILEGWPKISRIIGSSGTIRALERILRKVFPNSSLNRKNLAKLIKMMRKMTRAELNQIPGMEARRVDMILSGAILLEECMDSLNATEFTTTNYSLRDGILNRAIKLRFNESRSEISFKMENLVEKAKKFGAEPQDLKQSLSLSEFLFDRTYKLHKLKLEWKRYLLAASVLHDVGQAISPSHYEAHSYYILKNADFPGMEKWETEFISQLCLHQNTGLLSKKELSFTKDKARRSAFVKLLALLRIVEVFSHGQHVHSKIQKIRISKKQVTLQLSAKHATELAILRIEQKKTLFEHLFHRTVCIGKIHS